MDVHLDCFVVLIALASPAGARGETPSDTGGAPKQLEEEIVVTGSRVPRKDLTEPGPVVVYSREDIAQSGAASLGDFLQLLPWQSGGLNRQYAGGVDGATYVALRNLGPRRTLVLVDGQRWVSGGRGPGIGGAPAVDLNSIPTAAVARVEVLKDGASAIYGSDAIAGVVNIITQRRMNGVQADAYSGISRHGDGLQVQVSGTGGVSDDRGGFLVSLGYFHGSSVDATSRPWSGRGINYNFKTGNREPGGSTSILAGSAFVDPAKCPTQLCQLLNAAYPGAGRTTWIPDGSTALGVPVVTDPATGLKWRKFIGGGPVNDLYDFQPPSLLVAPSSRVQIFANGDYRLGEFARARMQASWVRNQTDAHIAAEPLFTSVAGATIDASNPYNPFGVPVSVASKRLLELGPRGLQLDAPTMTLTGALEGTVESTPWSLAFRYGRTSATDLALGSISKSRVLPGLGPAHQDQNGVWQCGAAGATIANCTPVNLFGVGSITPQMVPSLGGYTGVAYGWSQLLAFDAQVTRDLVQLAADRPAGAALGYEIRRESGGFQPDPIAVAGDSYDFSQAPVDGSYTVNEAFLEVLVPVVSNLPLADDLELQGVGRWSHYSSFGNHWTYMLGARWRPIRPITVRGTWSTAFRAPAIEELYAGQTAGFAFAVDPCASIPASNAALRDQCAAGPGGAAAVNNGNTSNMVRATIGGNPALQPETATTATVGAVIEPIQGLSLTADYYHVRMEDTVNPSIPPSSILGGCYPASTGSGASPNTKACSLIMRDPATGVITNLSDTAQNVGTLVTNGIDVALRYGVPTSAGRVRFLVDGNYLFTQDLTLPSGKVLRTAGNYDLTVFNLYLGVTPRLRFNTAVDYALGPFTAGIIARYIGGFDECASPGGQTIFGPGLCADQNKDPSTGQPYPIHRVSPYAAVDLTVGYSIKTPIGATTLALGMRNAFDTKPPVVYNSITTYADPTYDFVGRYFWGRVGQRF